MSAANIRSALKQRNSKKPPGRSVSYRNQVPGQSLVEYEPDRETPEAGPAAPVASATAPKSTDPISNLPPVTTSGWLRFRPQKLKRVVEHTPDPTIQAAIKRARAARKKKILDNPKSYLDELIVIGERVRLNEIGISDDTLRNPELSGDTIFFTPSYFPYEKDLNKVSHAKTVFSKVFAPGSNFSVDNPVPPCETSEYSLLKEGLENRLYGLRMDLPSKAEDVISMSVRNKYHVAEEINLIIQAIESDRSICTNYELNYQDGTSKEVDTYAMPLSRTDNKKFQTLLRQFAFLVLQSMNPIEGYEENMGDMKPAFLIKALEQQEISKEDMDEYLAEYGTSYQIPDVIAQTLSATDTQDDIYSLMLESELLNLVQYVKKSILDNLKDAALKTKFSADTKSQDTFPVKDQLIAILKWVLDEYSKNKTLITENIDAITRQQTSSSGLTAVLTEKDARIFELESNLLNKTSQLSSALKTIDSDQPDSNRVEKPDNTNRELRDIIAELKGERDVIREKAEKEKEILKLQIQALEKARGVSGVLEGALQTMANPKEFRFFKNTGAIANAVKSGETPDLGNSPLQELYKEFQGPNKPLSEECYLTYFISFMLKKLFTGNNQAYEKMNTFVNTYLNVSGNEKLDDIVHGMAILLKHSEASSLKPGYYDISNDPEFKERISALNGFFSSLLKFMSEETDINRMCQNLLRSFPYNKSLSFHPTAFILGNKIGITKYSYDTTNNTYTENGVIQADEYKTAIPYPLLFVSYIVFTRETLKISNNQNNCKTPDIIKNPQIFERTKLPKPTVKLTVGKSPL
jgi:hypothetical protein